MSGLVAASSNRATVTGVGTVVVRALQAGNSNYHAAIPLTNSFTAVKGSQSITFTLPATNTFTSNGLIPLNGRSSAGLTVTYISANTNILVISGSNAVMKRRGTNTITAMQAGNSNYLAAPNVVRIIIVK